MLFSIYVVVVLIGERICVAQKFPGLGGPNWRKDPFIRPKFFSSGEEKSKEEVKVEKLPEVQIEKPELQDVREVLEIPEGVEKLDAPENQEIVEKLPENPETEGEQSPEDVPFIPNVVPELSIKDSETVLDELPAGLEPSNDETHIENQQPLPDLPITINGLTPFPELLPLPNLTIPDTNPPSRPDPFGVQLRCQDPESHEFIPTAQACKDTRGKELCALIFEAPDPKTGKRDPKCDQKGFEDIASTCRNTCGLCCEDLAYSCEDDVNGIVDCAKQTDKCDSPKWFSTLSRYCAGTCGLCQKTSCRDNKIDCRILKGVCKIPEHAEQMKKDCARTCGYCSIDNATPLEPSGPAPDNGNGGGGIVDAECYDKNPRCGTWIARGFCESTFYTRPYKAENCKRSCQLC